MECLTNLTGTPVPDAVVRDVSRRTGGNPFFVTALGQLGQGADRFPEGVRAFLRSRLSLLPSATREILEVAAVFGLSFRADWLFSYQPNPGTVFFAGYGASLGGPRFFEPSDLERTSDGFFVKLSWLFRM